MTPPAKICPFLTVGSLAIQNMLRIASPQEKGVVGAQLQVSFAPCQGEACALWIIDTDRECHGRCSLEVVATRLPPAYMLEEKVEDFLRTERRKADALEKIAEDGLTVTRRENQ